MPSTIEHLGARLYSTMPPIVAELIANSLDADAHNILVFLSDTGEKELSVSDDGIGMSFDDINNKFLRIGRNRRTNLQEGGQTTPSGRPVIGKKGLGKLSFFGLAKQIDVTTTCGGLRNRFLLDWDKIIESGDKELSDYRPEIIELNTLAPDAQCGTTVTLKKLQRASNFNAEKLANSLSRYFIFEKGIDISISRNDEEPIHLDNERRYSQLDIEFQWDIPESIVDELRSRYPNSSKISGCIFSTSKPIAPSTGMRGITLFSRKNLLMLQNSFRKAHRATFTHMYQVGLKSILLTIFLKTLSTPIAKH